MARKIVQLIVTLLISALVWAQPKDDGTSGGKTVMISREYARGKFFIYDCDDRHFACVDEVSMQNCQLDRTIALRERKYRLPCTPLRSFVTEKECLKEHYHRIQSLSLKYFCLNQKNILTLDDEVEKPETVNDVIE